MYIIYSGYRKQSVGGCSDTYRKGVLLMEYIIYLLILLVMLEIIKTIKK